MPDAPDYSIEEIIGATTAAGLGRFYYNLTQVLGMNLFKPLSESSPL